MIRLNKYLANGGIASRRKCDELIEKGWVKVNGRIVKELGTRIDEMEDEVRVREKVVHVRNRRVYLVMNKPRFLVTSVKDEKDRKTVVDLVGKSVNVYPVGRLDLDTTGVLLLTNDGELTYRLTHPKFGVEKVYRAELVNPVRETDIRLLEKGVILEDGRTSPCHVKKVGERKLELMIHEGRKHQVKRMLEAVGNRVVRLHRSRFGTLTAQGLAAGQYRPLTRSELKKLFRLVKLDLDTPDHS